MAGDVGDRRARPRRRRAASCSPAATPSSTRRPRSASTPRSTGRRGQPARPDPGRRRRSRPARRAADRPHLIAVSTAYVAGTRRGRAPEALLPDTPFSHRGRLAAEVAAARRARADADAASRDPRCSPGSPRQARGELGAAGHAAAGRQGREAPGGMGQGPHWSTPGKARAQGLGWPDAYAYTKALGERALLESRGDVPVTIVRPSIIESALAEPAPGWIRGFRMAEPGHHQLRPGAAEGVPRPPRGRHRRHPGRPGRGRHHRRGRPRARRRTGPTSTTSASGARNPLRYRQLVDLVRDCFTRAPARTTPTASPSSCRSGPSRAGAGCSASSQRADQGPDRGREGPAGPAHPGQAGRARRPPRGAPRRRPSGPSATSSCTAPTPRPRPSSASTACVALWDSLPAEDQRRLLLRPRASSTGPHYVHDIHLPSVVDHARVRTTAGARRGQRRRGRPG